MSKQKRIKAISLILSAWFMLTLFGCSSKPAGGAKEPAGQEKADYEFYNGKTVTFIVATKPGGGYDTYARLLAPYLQKNLPGSTVIVKNVPGAGHIIGASELYNAKADGLTIGTFDKALIIAQLVGQEGVKFDLNKFTWLGNAASEPRTLIVGQKTPYQSVDDLKKAKEVKLGGTGIGSSNTNDALLIANILGLKVKMVNGYGGQEGDLAMIKGDIDGQVGAYSSMQAMINNKEARPLFTIGKKKVDNLPNLRDVAPADKKPLVDLMQSQAELSRLMAATPGIPEARARALREGIQKAFSDPELLAKAQQAKLPVDFMPGDEVMKLVKTALDQSPDVTKLLKEITGGKLAN